MKQLKERYQSGILMPISSLPSVYGIGNFGKKSYEFVDFLKQTGASFWQVLPLNPTSYGDSPYQSPASLAGNPYFIDPEILYQEKLITKEELKTAVNKSKRIDYGWLFNTRYDLLRKAHSRFSKNQDYENFVFDNKHWLEDYTLFMSLKVKNNYSAWINWDEKYRDINEARNHKDEFSEEMSFWSFIQYEFNKQYKALHDYANSLGIKLIGDMPIYVAHDSMDVWCNPADFLLDENYNPVIVAGCPPDGFAPLGQLWGNPIYNWEKMEEDGFIWWNNRIKENFKLYDVLRIDHFRGFAGYYTIPFGDENAVNGKWLKAPGSQLFKSIKKNFPKSLIIAEDLGFITDDVRALLKETGFPGMKILQFGFYDDNSEYLPRMFESSNSIVYTGSHDSDCTKTWYKNLDANARLRFKKEVTRRKKETATESLIRMALNSQACLAIIPIQDYLELENKDGRINTPSLATGNWTWKISNRYKTEKLINKIYSMNKEAKRV